MSESTETKETQGKGVGVEVPKQKRTGEFGKASDKFSFNVSTHLVHESRGPNAKVRSREKLSAAPKIEMERRSTVEATTEGDRDGKPIPASSTSSNKKPRKDDAKNDAKTVAPIVASNATLDDSAVLTTPSTEPLESEPGGNQGPD